MSTELAFPDPQSVTLAEIPAMVEQAAALRTALRADKDERIVEVYDRLGAIRQYVRNREARRQLEGEERRTEVVIGELLGPADWQRNGKPNDVRVFSDPLIAAFRKMAEHEQVVEAAIADQVTARSKILQRIERLEQPPVSGDWRLIESAVADLELTEPADVVVTDPPYPREFLPAWKELGAFAARSLKPGGSLFAMSGQSYLPEIVGALAESDLTYHWTLAYLTPGGQSVQLFDRHVNAFWKPVLWFVKGDYDGKWLGDVARSKVNDNDKASHDWGQSESGVADLMVRASEPGDLVVDPFVGGGTMAVVAVSLGRRFIGADVDPVQIQKTEARLA